MTDEQTKHLPTNARAEKSLHAALKSWYAHPGDLLEAPLDGYIIDIQRNNLLIEIQTRNFGALKHKITTLLNKFEVRIVYPIPREKWIVRQTAEGLTLNRRKSPKHGEVIDTFKELPHIATLLTHPNLSLEIVFIQEEEIWRDDGHGSWRRKHWSIHDRRLINVLESVLFSSPQDYLDLLPSGLPHPFTNHDLANACHKRISLARRITYTLRAIGCIQVNGKRGNTLLYNSNSYLM